MESEPRLGAVLYSRDQIAQRVQSIAAEIDATYAPDDVPVLVAVLRGATIFMSDLSRALSITHELDFLALSAYGEQRSGGQARVLKDVSTDIAGRHVLLIEDVIDTGLTLQFLMRYLQVHQPRSIRVATLLDRPHRRLTDTTIDFAGFVVPDRFYVGYGFDWQQSYRGLPDLVELLDVPGFAAGA